MKRAVAGWLASLCLLSGTAWAGGGPHNTLVIVNDNSPESQELGQYYQDLRGLPERHLVHVRTATNYSATLATFTNEVVQPVLDYLATAGLSNQIASSDAPAITYASVYATVMFMRILTAQAIVLLLL